MGGPPALCGGVPLGLLGSSKRREDSITELGTLIWGNLPACQSGLTGVGGGPLRLGAPGGFRNFRLRPAA